MQNYLFRLRTGVLLNLETVRRIYKMKIFFRMNYTGSADCKLCADLTKNLFMLLLFLFLQLSTAICSRKIQTSTFLAMALIMKIFFFSSRRRHTRYHLVLVPE